MADERTITEGEAQEGVALAERMMDLLSEAAEEDAETAPGIQFVAVVEIVVTLVMNQDDPLFALDEMVTLARDVIAQRQSRATTTAGTA